MKKTTLFILASILAMSSLPVLAAKKPVFFAGANGGITSIDTQSGNKRFEFNDDDGSWKVYGGVMLDENWGLEVGYYSFGSFNNDSKIDTFDIDDLYGVGLSLTPVIPIYKWISLVGRIGIAYWDADVTAKVSGTKVRTDDNGYDVLLGLAPRVTINDYFAVEAGWDRLNMDGDDVDMLSIGVRINTK